MPPPQPCIYSHTNHANRINPAPLHWTWNIEYRPPTMHCTHTPSARYNIFKGGTDLVYFNFICIAPSQTNYSLEENWKWLAWSVSINIWSISRGSIRGASEANWCDCKQVSRLVRSEVGRYEDAQAHNQFTHNHTAAHLFALYYNSNYTRSLICK